MRKLPDLTCPFCGKTAGRKANGRRRKVCLDCSINVSVKSALEMYMGQGTAYDRWKESAGPSGRPPKTEREE